MVARLKLLSNVQQIFIITLMKEHCHREALLLKESLHSMSDIPKSEGDFLPVNSTA
jgi:hypothetical protein